MPKEQSPGKPTTRRYTPEVKASAVRMVRALRAGLGDSARCIHHRVGGCVRLGRMAWRSINMRATLSPAARTPASTSAPTIRIALAVSATTPTQPATAFAT
jgi:transposase